MHGHSWLMTWSEAEQGWLGVLDLSPYLNVGGFSPCETAIPLKFVCPRDNTNDFKADTDCQTQRLYFRNDTSTGTGAGGQYVLTANNGAGICLGLPKASDTFAINNFNSSIDPVFGNWGVTDDCEPFSGTFSLGLLEGISGSALEAFCSEVDPYLILKALFCDVPANGDCSGPFVGGPILLVSGVITLP
jgi:hypothetical protein